MEGDPKDSDEDLKPQERTSSPHSAVVWEKCIQQSIFVDLSEDESVHLSDLEGSFAVRLSQAESAPSEASIHFSGNLEFSDLGQSSSEYSSVSSQSERVMEDKTKSSMTHVSAQRHNTMQEKPPVTRAQHDPGDTSDEDQEELPFDGDLGSPYFNHTTSSEGTSNRSAVERDHFGTLHPSPNAVDLSNSPAIDKDINTTNVSSSIAFTFMEPATGSQVEAICTQSSNIEFSGPGEGRPMCSSPDGDAEHPNVTQLLLRHFDTEELLCSGRLIEAETLPEVSLMESIDDTFASTTQERSRIWSPTRDHHQTPPRSSIGSLVTDAVQSGVPKCCGAGSPRVVLGIGKTLCEEHVSLADDMSPPASEWPEGNVLEAEEGYNIDPTSAVDCYTSNSESCKHDSRGSSVPDLSREEEEEEEEDEGQAHRVPLVRTRSFSELKYGQGQVHYPSPDFSKVTSKILKTPCGPVRPVSQSPTTFTRAQSSPGMLGMSSASRKATVEVINMVLEDSVQPLEKPYVFNDQGYEADPAPLGLVNHLQVEYDKLLTKYAEAENLIDQMRLGTKAQKQGPSLGFDYGDHPDLESLENNGGHFGSMPFPTPSPLWGHLVEEQVHQSVTSCKETEPKQSPSDGERMTDELKDVISQFLHKVEEFKTCVMSMSFSVEEQQILFKSMMEAQDQLERKYLSKKEEHRALEMQNYMGLARNTGTFDLERLVEGDIFRVGMYLEDIKDLIDRNVYEQLAPPPSSSTPTPRQRLCLEPGPPVLLTTSSPPVLHEGPSPCISTRSNKTKEEEEEEEEEEDEKETSEVQGGSEGISSLPPSVSLQNDSVPPLSYPRTTLCSLEGQDIAEVEEEKVEDRSFIESERTGHDDIPACLPRPTLISENDRWTPESFISSSGVQQSGLPWEGVYSPRASVSSVEVSSSSEPPKTQSQLEPTLNICQSTDSGFGSSDLSRPAAGRPHQKFTRQSGPSQSDGLSESDSEGSNLLTTVQPATLTDGRRASPRAPYLKKPFGGSAFSLWLSGTSPPEVPARLHESDPLLTNQLNRHRPACQSDPVLSITMDTVVAPQRETPHSHTCSCNSEAILSLQSEVSRLKRDLEEGLVQLPHLAQRMDHLTSKYRQERRAKTRPRTHHQHRKSNSERTTPLSRTERPGSGPSPVRMEDWISSDLDPSRSKGTDSPPDSNGLGMTPQFHSTPVGGRRGGAGPYLSLEAGKTAGKPANKKPSSRVSEGNCSVWKSDLTSSSLRTPNQGKSSYRTQAAWDLEGVFSKGTLSHLVPQSLQPPLLQVNYGSSSSLPAGFKVKDPPVQSLTNPRRRSTQSDTALLPSNVYFQRTLPPTLVSSKAGGRAGRRRGSKEEEMCRTLDRAIEAARGMKRTTDRMAKSLSADLAKAQLHRTINSVRCLGTRDHFTA